MREWNARFGSGASSSSAPISSDASSDTASSGAVSSDIVSSEPIKPVSVGIGKTAFVTSKTLIGRKNELLAMMTELRNAGYESVAVEMKPQSGILPYLSTNSQAKQYKLIDENAVDAAEVAAAAVKAGISPVAYMSALKDGAAPHVSRENSFAYGDMLETNWLDNSVANGGKPWLNPYMENTRGYIKSLAVELYGAGFGTVLLDNVIFPEKNTEKMNPLFTTPSREQALNLLVAEVEAELPQGTVIRIASASGTMMNGDGSTDAAFNRIPSLRLGMSISLIGIEANKENVCKNAGIIPTEGYNPAITAQEVAVQLILQAKTEWENSPTIVVQKTDEAIMLPILEKCGITDFIVM